MLSKTQVNGQSLKENFHGMYIVFIKKLLKAVRD